ncbi:hypothetical protein ACFSCX_01535 [Bacillus salitolerans]|uniref:Uncharacterized protein n=1 Tax=Bacillus salitolerans TaxID=1437434 RepID=A0ABW4LLE7_9BACI
MKVVRRVLIILSVLLIGFLTLVFSNSDLLNVGVVAIVIVTILKQIGLFGSQKDFGHDGDDSDYGYDSDWDDDGDD